MIISTSYFLDQDKIIELFNKSGIKKSGKISRKRTTETKIVQFLN